MCPRGVGALYIRLGVPIEPILFGEGCEAGIRPGTANVPHIVGLGQAARLAQAGLESAIDRTSQMRDRFHRQLESLIGRAIVIHGRMHRGPRHAQHGVAGSFRRGDAPTLTRDLLRPGHS